MFHVSNQTDLKLKILNFGCQEIMLIVPKTFHVAQPKHFEKYLSLYVKIFLLVC